MADTQIDAETMRSTIVTAIGRDNVYITAGEEQRRFDPISIASLYAGSLLFGFLRAAGGWLWQTLKEKGEDTIKQGIGDGFDAILKKAEGALKAASPQAETAASTDLGAQAAQLDIAADAIKALGTSVESPYVEKFLAAGQAAVAQQLVNDNFPEAKAQRVAAAVALQIELKIGAATAPR